MMNMNWCELKGSPRQIPWAEEIRQKKVGILIDRKGPIENMNPVRKAGMLLLIENVDDAGWWIDNRNADAELVMRYAMNAFGGYNVPV